MYIKSLTKPRPEFNNLPICPALAQYRHEIQIIRARDNLEDQINQACWMMYPLNIPAVVIVTALPPTNLYDITDAALVLHPGIEIFVNDPTATGSVRGIYTGFKDGWLIIIQRLDILEEQRELAKKAGYYTINSRPE